MNRFFKNYIRKLPLVLIVCACVGLLFAGNRGGFDGTADTEFEIEKTAGFSTYIVSQPSFPPSVAVRLLYQNQEAYVSCFGIETFCRQVGRSAWIDRAELLKHKHSGRLFVLNMDYTEDGGATMRLHNRYKAQDLPVANRWQVWTEAGFAFSKTLIFLSVLVFVLFAADLAITRTVGIIRKIRE